MEKVIDVGGQQIRMRASALVPRLYRFKFGRDMISDMRSLQQSMKKVLDDRQAGDDTAELSMEDLTIFEDLAYIMAKHADPTIPDSPEEWLERFNVFSIYQVLPEIITLWGLNMRTESDAKKNFAPPSAR